MSRTPTPQRRIKTQKLQKLWSGDGDEPILAWETDTAADVPQHSARGQKLGKVNRTLQPLPPGAGKSAGQAKQTDVMHQNYFDQPARPSSASSAVPVSRTPSPPEVPSAGSNGSSMKTRMIKESIAQTGPPRPSSQGGPRPQTGKQPTLLGAMSGTTASTPDRSSSAGSEDVNEIAQYLANILRSKCGSLERAFAWFADSNSGYISGTQWGFGLASLKLDGPLRGIKPRRLFQLIDKERTGTIDMEAWCKFFDYTPDRGEGSPSPETVPDGNGNDVTAHLAQLLREKFGSLDEAFRWLDKTDAGKVSVLKFSGAFDSIPMEGPLKKMRPRKLFSMIDNKNMGFIDLDAWRAFFCYDEADDMALRPPATSAGRSVSGSRLFARTGQATNEDEEELRALLDDLFHTKCGTLDNAFNWLNSNHSGAITGMQWTSALGVVKLPDSLKQVRPRKLFAMVSRDKNEISLEDWRVFFKYEQDLFGDVYDVKRGSILGCSSGPLSEHDYPALLAQALREHCGSLNRAFKWLDINGSNDVSPIEWTKGLKALNLEGPLAEVKWATLYNMIDRDGSGHLSVEEWRDFFKYQGDDTRGSVIATGNVSVWLAQVLRDRCGCLDRAFRWLDNNRSGRISPINWNSGIGMLKFEGPLKGYRSRKLYSMVDHGGVGHISLEMWRSFFEYTPEDVEDEKVAMEVHGELPDGTDADLRPLLQEILLEKHGSLDEAFKWFDSNHNGTISSIEWSSTYDSLQLKGPLKNIKARKIFMAMDLHLVGYITLEQWHSFFGYFPDGEPDYYAKPLAPSRSPSPGPIEHASSHRSRQSGHSQRWAESLQQDTILEEGDVALQQRVEAEILLGDIAEQGFSGAFALAYILVAKLGSLDAAYRWLDSNRTGNFTRSRWDMVENVLHLELTKVAGVSAFAFFKEMDTRKKACVSKSDWNTYFAKVVADPAFKAAVEKLQEKGGLTELAREKVEAAIADRCPSKQATPDNAIERKNSTQGKNSSIVKPSGAASGYNVRRASTEPASAPLGDSSSIETKPKLPTESTPEVKDMMAQIGQRIRDQLLALAPDTYLAVPSGRPLTEYGVYEQVSWELGYRVFDTSKGSAESRLLHHEGPETARIREQLRGLCPAESLEIKNLHQGMLLMVEEDCKINELLMQKSSSSSTDANSKATIVWNSHVWNLNGNDQEWAEGVRKRCKKLNTDEILDFPAALSKEKRDIVEQVAGEMRNFGIFAEVLGEGRGQRVAVGQLGAFSNKVRQRLTALNPGEVHDFGGECRPLERAVLKKIAEEMHMKCTATLHGGEIHVKVRRPEQHEAVEKENKQPVVVHYKSDEAVDIDDLLAQLQGRDPKHEAQKKLWVQRFFEKYSSGRRDGKAIFMRRKDLKQFTKDVRRLQTAAERLSWKSISCHFDDLFDDTWDLQRMLGSGARHGLDFEYFHVFVDKVATEFGWSAIGQFVSVL